MNAASISLTVYIDGGSRGNPGPAAAGVVVASADDQTVLREAGIFLGKATNNVAEYQALLAGLRAAAELGAKEVTVVSDSQLLVRQMTGEYRVRNAGLGPLHQQAQTLRRAFAACRFRHVPREQNTHADRMVNMALDLRQNVGDAAAV
jgi:ribonuclease H / adenosylcobalamin/alpha-ribazole phosphatase